MTLTHDIQKPSQTIPLLSILAEPPPRSSGDPENSDSEPSIYIDAVAERLEPTIHNGLHTLKTANSIFHLQKCILDFSSECKRKFNLQIIGHGQSGHLDLGQAWRGMAPYFDGTEYWRLAADAGIMNILWSTRGKLANVTLAACQVGSKTPLFEAVDGTTLLFTLEHLWGCPVLGAIQNMDFSYFDPDTGVFIGPVRTWDDRPLDRSRIQMHFKYADAGRAPVVFRELEVSAGVFRSVPFLLNKRLLALYSHQRLEENDPLPGSAPLLASPEFEFKVTTSSPSRIAGRATISLGGTCMTLAFPELPADHNGFVKIGRSFYRHYFASNAQDEKTLSVLNAVLSELKNLSC